MRAASDPLSATFFALADPTRRAILLRLARGAATVKELAAPFRVSGPAISKHLRRPRTLEAAPLKDVAEWAEEFRRFWDASYARLDSYLQQLDSEEKSDGKREG
jgi:DNA-binding transcriptional ArsR family regulator